MALVISGCGGLPKEVRERANAIPETIKAVRTAIDKNRENFQKLKASPDFSPLTLYSEREKWETAFDTAAKDLDRAEELYETTLAPLVKENDVTRASVVTAETDRINHAVSQAQKKSRYPFDRFDRLRDAVQNIRSIHERSLAEADEVNDLVGFLKNNPVEKARTEFPEITEKIDARFAPFLKFQRDALAAKDIVQIQYRSHNSGSEADIALFADNADLISTTLASAKTLEKTFQEEIKQLYSSYTKILQDMKAEYDVVIARESWDENSDFYNPAVVKFQRQIDEDLYEALDESTQENIAQIDAGMLGSKFRSNIGDDWDDLKINPGENWPGRAHNAAVFFVESASEKYFHKYLLEENGEQKETGWVPVSAELYDSSLELLGMALLSKPYGVFESERLTQAAPPGMAYVGNPKYGEWQKDNSGNQFWSWYGKYAFFSALFFSRPSFYSYNSWNTWNRDYRNRKPYFGQTGSGGAAFGTQGSYVKTSPKFQNSTFAKSGGLKDQAPSVRGAGAKLRGGGPNSKGK